MATEQQKQNLRRIYAMAGNILAEKKREAVESGDFDQSLGIASNEAVVESILRERYGVEVAIKHRGENWVMFCSSGAT